MSRTPGAPGCLVLGGDYRGLGIVRGLGRLGVRVWVVHDEHRLAAWSRYCERAIAWREPGGPERVAFLRQLATDNALGSWTLIPTDDAMAALIARHREELAPPYRHSILVGWDTLRWAYDKRLTYRLAKELGVPFPATLRPRDRADVERYAGPFPAIVKPAMSPTMNALAIAKAWPAADAATLVARYDAACAITDPELLLIQEILPGDGRHQLSYAALCRDGTPIASLVARRARQWPMDFGRASTFVETIEDEEVETSARRILARLRFSGVVEVEFKRDVRDGSAKLLDINPRFWGWHTLGARAGIDFSQLLWRMLSGDDLAPARGRSRVRWVRALTDVPMAIREMRGRRLAPWDYLASLRGPIEWAVLARDDPVPALVELPLTLGLARRRHA